MDKLTTTLLTGAAMSALSVVPALAGAHPMMAVKTAHGAISMKGNTHYKTGIHNPGRTVFTVTFGNFTYTGARSTLYHKTVDVGPPFVWYTVSTGGHCVNYHFQHPKATKSTVAKIKVYTTKIHTTVHTTNGETVCSGTLTFYGPSYELKSMTATMDSFQMNDGAYFTTTTTTTGTKHKKKKHKYDEVGRENFKLLLH